jgi:putative DNA-invertase from lambdoid prophage Rac
VQETTVIPVVALSANPAGSGLAASLARPGRQRGDTLVVRWIDWLGRNYADVTDTIRELIRRQIRIETIINRITFDGTTTDPMQQAVRDALIRMDGNVVRPSERMRPIR